MAERRPSKPVMRVRFPSPAPSANGSQPTGDSPEPPDPLGASPAGASRPGASSAGPSASNGKSTTRAPRRGRRPPPPASYRGKAPVPDRDRRASAPTPRGPADPDRSKAPPRDTAAGSSTPPAGDRATTAGEERGAHVGPAGSRGLLTVARTGGALVAMLVASVGWGLLSHDRWDASRLSEGAVDLRIASHGEWLPSSGDADIVIDLDPRARSGERGFGEAGSGAEPQEEGPERLHEAEPGLAAALPKNPAMLQALAQGAREHGLDPQLLAALSWHESRLNPRAQSGSGAIGLLQLKPSTTRWVGDELGVVLDPWDPHDNATAGAAYLRRLIDRYEDPHKALVAYNQGSGVLAEQGPYRMAEDFADAVLATRQALHDTGWEPPGEPAVD